MDKPYHAPSAVRIGDLSRRSALRRLGAGLAVAALRPAIAPPTAAAQVATPAAPSGPPLPELSGVAPLPLAGERLAAFAAYVTAKLAESGVPGAAVAVVQGGEVAFLQGFGVRQLGRPAPVTADTLLRIGSVTKSFSSLLVATLVDAGRLDWETPLVDLLPGFAVADPALTPRLTVRDAFCACSGLPRRDWEFIFNAQELTPELLVAGMPRLPLTAPYGATFQYSNQLVAVGGFAAAVADGGSPDALGHAYAIALRDRVLNPIGMERTTLDLAEVVSGDDYGTPHGQDQDGILRPLPPLEDDTWLVSVAPSGALWSSAREMARYVQTELGRGVAPDGARVVSAANLERTWQPGVRLPAPPPETSPALATYAGHYGLGWVIGAYGGQRLIWHSGGTLGFTSLLTLLPEADLGVVVLTNGPAGAAGAFTTAATFRLLEILFDQPATIDAALAPANSAVAQGRAGLLATLGPVDPTAVAPYLGRWVSPDLGEVTLALREGTLLLDTGELRSELQPQMDAAGAAVGYLPADPPLASFPPALRVTVEEDAAGEPRMVLTATADPGQADLVYPFARAGGAATPTP